MPFLRTNQVTLYYEVHGKGHPIVLLHGFTSSFRGTWQASGWVTDLTAWGFRVLDAQLISKRTRLLLIAGPSGTKQRIAAAMEVFFPGSS